MFKSSLIRLEILAAAAMALLMTGCGGPSKDVIIRADPFAGTTVRIFELRGGERGDKVAEGPAPLKESLEFGSAGTKYLAVASCHRYRDASCEIVLEPEGQKKQEVYELKLVQYFEDLKTHRFEPAMRDGLLRMDHREVLTEAYLDPAEKSPNITAITELPLASEPGDFDALDASPADNLLVYQVYTGESPGKTIAVGSADSLDEFLKLHPELDRGLVVRLNPGLPRHLSSEMHLKLAEDRTFTKLVRRPTDGSSVTPIGQIGGTSLSVTPAFSASGKEVLFASNWNNPDPNVVNLWRIPLDANTTFQVTQPSGQVFDPSVGPDGRTVFASLSPNAGSPQIWMVPPGGGQPGLLYPSGESPQFSPDGAKVLFIRRVKDQMDGRRQLWRVSDKGTALTQLSQNNNFDITHPRWSPDGKWIAFASNEGKADGKQNWDIWVMPADDFAKRLQLTTNGSVDDNPVWDRNGNAIYFRSNRGAKWNVWRVDVRLPG